MIGKKALILSLLVVVVVQVVSPVQPVMAQSSPPIFSCISQVDVQVGNVFNYLGGVLTSGIPLFVANLFTSAVADPPEIGATVLGTGGSGDIGGVGEPFDEIVDFLFNKWMWMVLAGVIGSFIAIFFGYLVDFAFSLNLAISKSVVISSGYGTILALVNLGFVIAIIVIAFATMFRRSGWDMQSSLAKLIIAALLVNFSLFIGLGLVDVSTSLTSAILSSGDCPGINIASKFNVTNTYSSVENFLSSAITPDPLATPLPGTGSIPTNPITMLGWVLSFLGSLVTVITSPFGFILWLFEKFFISILALILGAMFTIIGAATLLAIFLFLIGRYVAVSILLIFMPIAWLGFIFPKLNVPGLGNAWSGWWTKFMKWIFIGPLIAFLLRLSLEMITYLNSPQAQTDIAGIGLIGGLAQMLVVVVFSLAGLYVANQVSAVGASMVYGGVASFGLKQLASIKASGMGAAASLLRTKPVEKAAGWMAGGKLTIPGTKFKIPTGMKEVGRAAMEAEAYTRKQAEAGAKRYDGLTVKQKNQLLPGLRRNSAEYARVMGSLLKDGDLDMDTAKRELDRARAKPGLEWTKNEKLYKDLEKFAVSTSKSIEATVRGNMEEAAKATAKLVESVKDNEWGKKFKLNKIFEDIKMEDFKQKDGTYDTDTYNIKVKENAWDRERVIRGIALNQPEKLERAFRSLAAGEQRINFVKAKEESHFGSVDNKFDLIKFDSEIPRRSKEYYVASPAPVKTTIDPKSRAGKLFKNVMGNPQKDTIDRDELEGYTKKGE